MRNLKASSDFQKLLRPSSGSVHTLRGSGVGNRTARIFAAYAAAEVVIYCPIERRVLVGADGITKLAGATFQLSSCAQTCASDLRTPLRSATLLIMEPSGITAFRQLECRELCGADCRRRPRELVARLDDDDDFAGANLQIPESLRCENLRRSFSQSLGIMHQP